MTGAERVLEVAGLKAGYGGVEVLRGIDLAVGTGEIVAVLGSNGVGKTTLNKVLSGVLPARAGQITFEGRRLDGVDAAAIVEAGLIQVPEGRKIFPNLDIQENLELGSYRRARKNRARNLERVYETFPRLRERRTQAAGTLSGGEQQMLAIGRALMTNPRLLILDEATEGLAPLIRQEIWSCLARIKAEGLSILVVDKNVADLLKLADRHTIIEKGRVVWAGSSAELAADEGLQARYLGV